MVVVLALLSQLYQFQIEFLRHVRQAADLRLTRAATEEWFAERVGGDPGGPAIPPLISFLVTRELLTLEPDDHYALTNLAETFLDRIEGYWYAPKAY